MTPTYLSMVSERRRGKEVVGLCKGILSVSSPSNISPYEGHLICGAAQDKPPALCYSNLPPPLSSRRRHACMVAPGKVGANEGWRRRTDCAACEEEGGETTCLPKHVLSSCGGGRRARACWGHRGSCICSSTTYTCFASRLLCPLLSTLPPRRPPAAATHF